jgi:hypothetical protein
MTKSNTNSVKSGKYTFQPQEYDEDDNLICYIYRCNAHGKNICKLIGTYLFNENKFEINWKEEGWLLNRSHKRLINFFLEEYDWPPIKTWKINYFINSII